MNEKSTGEHPMVPQAHEVRLGPGQLADVMAALHTSLAVALGVRDVAASYIENSTGAQEAPLADLYVRRLNEAERHIRSVGAAIAAMTAGARPAHGSPADITRVLREGAHHGE